MTFTEFLSRFESPKKSTRGYMVRCPGPTHQHGDRKRSLSIAEGNNGGTLLYCFSGCSPAEIVGAMGLEMTDLFPDREGSSNPRQRSFSAYDALIALDHELGIAQVVLADLAAGKPIPTDDLQRLGKAAERIRTVREVLRNG